MTTAYAPRDLFSFFSTTTDTAEDSQPMTITATPRPTIAPPAPAPGQGTNRELRIESAAVRVSFTWFGTKKAVTKDQKQTMADNFDAEGDFLSAGKKLLNTRHPAYKAVTEIRSNILKDWRDSTLPFPESGTRLIPRDQVDPFQARMVKAREDFNEAVRSLDAHFDEIREEARRRLGSLFNSEDYPASIDHLFTVSWDFPNVEPPSYLMQLNPEIYRREQERVAGQFDEAIRLAEEAFTEQFAHAIGHLCERLGRAEDGSPKVFRDTAVSNLTDFFERFKALNVRSNAQLDALVDQAQQAVRGASPAALRQSTDFRETVARNLEEVSQTLAGMMVDKPRRKILRAARTEEGGEA